MAIIKASIRQYNKRPIPKASTTTKEIVIILFLVVLFFHQVVIFSLRDRFSGSGSSWSSFRSFLVVINCSFHLFFIGIFIIKFKDNNNKKGRQKPFLLRMLLMKYLASFSFFSSFFNKSSEFRSFNDSFFMVLVCKCC